MDHNSVKKIWMDVLHVLTTDLLVVVIQYYKSLGKIWGSFCEGTETENIQKSIH